MATLLPYRYPLDYTGVSTDNTVIDEPHEPVRRKVRCIAPMHAPFFKDSLKIYDGTNPTPLTEGSQYKCMNIIPLPTAMADAGKEVYALIAILDESVGDELTLDYQTIGGDYVQSYEAALNLLEALTNDTRPAAWPNIIDKPQAYPPALHLHAVGDAIGWEYVAVQIQQVREAIINGDAADHQAILQYIDIQTAALTALIAAQNAAGQPLGDHIADLTNPHATDKAQVGLGLVQNFPVATVAEAQAGTALDRYMTPSLVAAAIENINSVSLGAHPSNLNNPHQTTKDQVGLGNVQNYPMATTPEAVAGTAADRYMSPKTTKELVDTIVTNTGNIGAAHIADMNNPHGTTKDQVGLGNVSNFGVATVPQTVTGTAVNLFVTPAGVKGAVDVVKAAQEASLAAHVARVDNPHATTKAQIGLDKVANYDPATDAEGVAGVATDKYMTPKATKATLLDMDLDFTTKVDQAAVGAPSGVAPLNGDALIDPQYLTLTPGSNIRDIHYFGVGEPLVNSTLWREAIARPISWAALWAGSVAYCSVAPSADVVITIKRNADVVGTITILAGQQTGTFAGAAGTAVVNDVISLHYDNLVANAIRDLTLSLIAAAYVP